MVLDKQDKQDKRVKKTKQCIKNALVDLLIEKPINNITVKEICEVADINRSTFYAHYTDQQQLMHIIEEEYLIEFKQKLSCTEADPENLYQKIKTFLDFVSQNQKTCLALMGIHGNKEILKGGLLYRQNELYNNALISKNTNQETRKIISMYLINANASVICEWLQTGMQTPIDELADILQKLSLYGVSDFLDLN